ncbi:class I SAM-dependent methyltransferase [Litoribrevibacter albus]|uniref:Methyltransferase domain-containing protein n=1 Tax=Litoribrevibacter albus TaxID=1473156 RepID=A0AA37SA42_9GAMM|nr:class I SAM-dependent methyltransferase [Litoribrevibacter albus]GLQ31980.1 hypothetical protein GCM10007876_24590 [Litoribrevibacter albus]
MTGSQTPSHQEATPSDHEQQIIAQFSKQAVPFTKLPGHSDAIEDLVRISGATSSSRVLDVACGPGLVVTAFAAVAQQVEGIDLTPAMLEQAEKQVKQHGLSNATFRQGDANHLPYDDASFDVVVTRYSFHHFEQPDQVLSEMVRVCKPGGTVVVADVEIHPDQSELYNRIERLRDPSHTRAMEHADYQRMFGQSVFSEVKQYSYRVVVELEKQLAVSFPEPGDDDKIRELLISDVDVNQSGFRPYRTENGVVHYSYPISVYAGVIKDRIR